MSMSYRQILDRPVFIMAAPRSGSTLLFETLVKARGLYSTGDENHGLIEQFPALKPERRSSPSNLLTAEDADDELGEAISEAFVRALVDSNSVAADHEKPGSRFRMIEKTPKNILRIPFFNAIYADALFIYLYRNPLQNISSIIDGWGSGHWSFLLPPGWEKHKNDRVESMAAWQWLVSQQQALDSFADIDRSRVFALNYDDFLQQPAQTVKQLCEFIDVDFDEGLASHCAKPLPYSRYTLSEPAQDKWKRNAGLLAQVIDSSSPVIARINQFAANQGSPLAMNMSKAALAGIAQKQKQSVVDNAEVSRNNPCPCGSGKKYKRCHGALSSQQDSL